MAPNARKVASVWANEVSVYGTQKTVPSAQVSVYRTQNFFAHFGKMLNFCLEPRTKILAHFKGSECEIAFLDASASQYEQISQTNKQTNRQTDT